MASFALLRHDVRDISELPIPFRPLRQGNVGSWDSSEVLLVERCTLLACVDVHFQIILVRQIATPFHKAVTYTLPLVLRRGTQ